MKLVMKDGKLTWVPDAIVKYVESQVVFPDDNASDNSPEADPADDPEEAFRCPHCDKEYVSEAALKKHIASKHSTDTE